MDLGTLATAAVMLAVCILPFVLMNQKKQKRIKHLKQTFNLLAKENNQSIGDFDVCGGIAIGLDSTSTTIFFVNENASSNVKINQEIKNIASVSIEKINLNESSSFERIVLSLHLKGNTSKLIQFVLFDSNNRLQLDGELQLSEKWLKKIQALL